MNLFAIFESLLCLSTLGTFIPTLYLSKKLPGGDLSRYFLYSGFMVGLLFCLADQLKNHGYSHFWGFHTWLPVLLHVFVLIYLLRRPMFPLKQALQGTLLLQLLLISAIPMTHDLFREETLFSQGITYGVLTGCFTFIFWVASRVVIFYRSDQGRLGFGTYLYVFLLLLVAIEPITGTLGYRQLIYAVANTFGLLPMVISVILHLLVLPLLCYIPYQLLHGCIKLRSPQDHL